jgi:uroporphyrinogen decarboxylase
MNRRERFAKITSFQEADRVPMDMGSHVASIHRFAYARLRAYLNDPDLKNNDNILDRMVQNVVPDEKLLRRYEIDFRWIAPNWVGVTDVAEDIYRDMWGIEWKYGMDAFNVHVSPLASAQTEADIKNHPWPDPTDSRLVSGLTETAKKLFENTDYVLVADAIKGGILTKALQIRGYEPMFMDMAINPDLAIVLMDQLLELYKQFWSTFLRAVGPYVQMVYITDDIGGQSSMIISPKMFRQLLKPRLAALIDHIKSEADVKLMYHTDGVVTPVIEDIIEMGVDVLNPIQTSAMEMDTAVLKEKYHGRLCFHGAIDVQQMLPFSTPAEVRYDVARRINDLAPGGGYILAPCHNISANVPPENIEAMYAAAAAYGRYPLKLDHVLGPEPQ